MAFGVFRWHWEAVTRLVHEGGDHMGGVRAHVPEQAPACGGSACALPGGFARVAGGMRGEGRQVGRRRYAGRAPAPVSEIVLRVAPVGPVYVEGLVPDPPSCASARGGFGDEAVASGHLAVGLGDPELRPGGAERITNGFGDPQPSPNCSVSHVSEPSQGLGPT